MPPKPFRPSIPIRNEHAHHPMCVFIVVLAFLLSCSAIPWSAAHADVRKDDVISGSTMEERGLSASVCPTIDAQHAFVVDSNGEVFFERNAEEETQIASITKIMTALVALETAPLDTPITVSSYAASVGESTAGLQAGDVIDLEQAIMALMIPSGNDAAIAIAESLGSQIIDSHRAEIGELEKPDGTPIGFDDGDAPLYAFVWKMNDLAAELGCTDTVFENPHGLDNDAFQGNLHSTAEEVSKIASTAMQLETFRDIVRMHSATLEVERGGQKVPVEIESTDLLLGNYEGACGIKTGYTKAAGSCFAGACERDGRYLYAIVLDSSSDIQRFNDAEALFDWVYENQVDFALAHSDERMEMDLDGVEQEVPIVGAVACRDWIDKTVPVTFADPEATVQVFRLDGNVSQDFDFYEVGSAKAGDVVGRATFYQRNSIIATQDIIACEDCPAPNLIEAAGIWWDRLMRSFSGESTVASSYIVNETPLIFEK